MFGPYAGYIVPAYLVSGLAIAALAGTIIARHARLKRDLAAMEAAGVRRRSAVRPSPQENASGS